MKDSSSMTYSHIAAAGTTKRKRKLANSRNSEKGRQGFSWRSYCPFCVAKDPAHPQFSLHVTMRDANKPRVAKCVNGHSWATNAASRCDGISGG